MEELVDGEVGIVEGGGGGGGAGGQGEGGVRVSCKF